ncbi:hypothetical protein V6Z11_D09G063800 [Gossypium hirsutum]
MTKFDITLSSLFPCQHPYYVSFSPQVYELLVTIEYFIDDTLQLLGSKRSNPFCCGCTTKSHRDSPRHNGRSNFKHPCHTTKWTFPTPSTKLNIRRLDFGKIIE